ncbi:hypothetical protein ABIC74_000814 [Mucilaginibacter rubeus]
MKVADLYIRVSTDEQADKGYPNATRMRHCSDIANFRVLSSDRLSMEITLRRRLTAPHGSQCLVLLKRNLRQRRTTSFLLNGTGSAEMPPTHIR